MHGIWKNNQCRRYKPVRNVHAEVPHECDEVEHRPLCIYLLSLLQGRILSRHVPELDSTKNIIAMTINKVSQKDIVAKNL